MWTDPWFAYFRIDCLKISAVNNHHVKGFSRLQNPAYSTFNAFCFASVIKQNHAVVVDLWLAVRLCHCASYTCEVLFTEEFNQFVAEDFLDLHRNSNVKSSRRSFFNRLCKQSSSTFMSFQDITHNTLLYRPLRLMTSVQHFSPAISRLPCCSLSYMRPCISVTARWHRWDIWCCCLML